MAGEAGAAVLQGLVQNLIDLTTNQISQIYGLDGEAQNLIQNLDTIQQFLNDAETRTIPSGDVKIWLKWLENAAFEADDVLDELHYHAHSSKLNTDITKKKVPFIDIILSPFTDIGRKRKMGVLIQEINMNFNSINEMATRLGLQKKLADAPTVVYTGMETDSVSADPIFIGRGEVVSEIVETLITSVATHHQRVFSILPIVGMGGLGKTTLTRKVFHHQKMETQFRSRIWVHVSQVFDPINLFKKILEALPSSQSGQVESKQGILSKLKEALKDKTYLLVLDDAWNEEPSKWEDFLNSLSGVTNTKGNAIIVTTRSMKVASIEGALDIHELKGLTEEDCWKIISAKTFGNEDVVPLDIESVGREIAKRCGGLPLAASVVGGVLRCDKSVDKWDSIRDNWLPEDEGEGENIITKILKLSFNNLSSPSLKRCFAYCSIFPKGKHIWKKELIEMWMGEGFLGSNDDMESVGDKFYNVLLHSSLLQNVESYEDLCVMHDLVHDLASSVLGNADGVSRVRYLFHDERHSSSPITKEVAQHLRTLIFEADQPFDDNIFSDFKSLHVLILKGMSCEELPRSIRKLIHLRNLNITETSIRHLPDWIGELHHLQTLRAERVWELPSTIKYLINLRHLHVRDDAELPAEIGRLTSLQTRLGLQKKLAPTALYTGMETDSFSADPIFIGRDEVVSEIVETLITSVATHDDECVFSILPIVGMGGLGKTTLTRNVFHHQRMETQFESRIWVHVSQVFDPINMFKKIFKELTSSESDQGEISRQEILKKLKEALKDKTYLLVLDDAWNEEPSKWEDFLNSLSGVTNTKGNAIIVTTRSMKGALRIHELKGLSEEDCWKIIRAKTFGNEDVPLDFESIGREIARRCCGLPLAASVVGGVLRCDKSVDNWVSIRDNWLPQGEGEGENIITKILKLSFNNLSPSLKTCFAYCSIFPKGYGMTKEELIEMWMGEGFLGSNEDMESVGDKFYNVLLHSSLLQVYYGDWCVMHDLVHDLASSVLGNADGVSRVRYLFHKVGESSPIKKEVAQHLRTLIFQADQPFDDNIFSDFKCLHVLILKGRSFEELPRSIRKLIHLRNLNISHSSIRHLPDWIGELHHLQTLRAGHTMQKLPSTIKYLINLRHLPVSSIEKLPAEIGRLTSLQTLWHEFIVRDENGYKIEELGSLNNLKGQLRIKGLEKVHDKEEAEKANLSKKSKLSELILEWTSSREEVESINDENVLEGLQPHSNLKNLFIWGFNGKRFPEWTLKMAVRNEPQGSWIGLNQLVDIEFYGCRACEEIPMLGHLPNLKSLKIRHLSNVKSINSSFYGIGKETGIVFPALETLELFRMDSLKEWAEVESGSTSEVKVFPNLRSLEISNCNQLMKVPINHFSSCLKSLEISGCNQLTTDSYLPLLSKLTSLTSLVLEGLNGLESLPDELFYNNPNLSALQIISCPKLREIPDGLQTLNSLKQLIIQECPNLKRIGCSSGGSLTSLAALIIRGCHGLMDLPYEMVESLSALELKRVMLKGLSSLSYLPRVIECLAKSAAGLTELTIVGVPKFMATSVDQVWHFPKLWKLEIDVEGSRETSVTTGDRILQGCNRNSLRWLSLMGVNSWECLPESIQHLISLDQLKLYNFGMEELPKWFDQYISRTNSRFYLTLSECKRLRRLPSTPAMRHLIKQNKVYIQDCPELQQQSDDGSE